MRRAIAIGFLALLGVAPASGTAWAKDPEASATEEVVFAAKELAAKKQRMEAVRLLSLSLAQAQKRSDLVAEGLLADAFEEVVDDLDREIANFAALPPGTPTARKAPERRVVDLLAPVMLALEAKRHGLFVSAHALATELLLDAALTGASDRVTEAANVLETFGAAGRAGRAGTLLSQWGTGVKAARAAQPSKATPLLEAAEKGFAEIGAFDLALAVAIERADVLVRAGDEAKAAEALAAVGLWLGEAADPAVVRAWIRGIRGRWTPARPALLAALKPVFDRYELASVAGGVGGRGAHGASAGENLSPLGRAWKSLGPDKAIVRVTRGLGGYTTRVDFDKSAEHTRAVAHGEAPWDGGGVSLAFAGPMVALRMLDLAGTAPQPGGRSRRSFVRAFYVVAERETMTVTKGGVLVAGV